MVALPSMHSVGARARRAGRELGARVSRLLGVGLPVSFGASSGGGVPVSPHYPVDASERAFATNPWVRASYRVITTDLSSLPLIVEVGTGTARRQIPDHWLLSLLNNPHPKVSGRKLRKQLAADLLSGNAYARVWRDPTSRPVQLSRIPPALIQPIVADDGEEIGYRLPAQGRTLAWADVLHVADINLSSTSELVLGANPMEALALGLQVDRDSRKNAGRAARRGKLEMLLSPKDAQTPISEERTKALSSAYGEAMEAGHGVYVSGVGLDATPVSLTARDSEFLGMNDRTRGEILAVLGVPETRVGSPAANYGTAREQSRIYWLGLQAWAALIDDELSRLAEPGTRIRHDFASVDALQPSRSERLARVLQLVSLGMAPDDALRYEGFVDAPHCDPAAAAGAAQPAPSASGVQEPRKAVGRVLGTLQLAASVYAAGEEADLAREVSRSLLRTTLAGLGCRGADAVAAEAALVLEESVRSAEGGELIELRAFGRDHANRIVRLAGLQEAA